jgi:uncharacterized protein (TIGR01777 family)
MKIVIPGGTGQVGSILCRALQARGHEVVVLSRHPSGDTRTVLWDGRTLGEWTREIDGAQVVLNLAGRSVNCRYTAQNREQMMRSRIDSTVVVGRAIAGAANPPAVWLQMSTATIYAHRFDAPNDEATGRIGGGEDGAPSSWTFSVEIARAWEEAQRQSNTPRTRKVTLRTAVVLSPDRGGIFDVMLALTRAGLGGPIAGGDQFVSWIHDGDLARAAAFLIEREDLEGAVNLSSPHPLPQRDFMATLRRAWGTAVGLPATRWMVEIGAFLLRTESELVLKSRRVVPTRLLEAEFAFRFPEWEAAANDLVSRWRARRARL